MLHSQVLEQTFWRAETQAAIADKFGDLLEINSFVLFYRQQNVVLALLVTNKEILCFTS